MRLVFNRFTPISPDFSVFPLKYHSILRGRSPLLTVHVTKTISCAFTGSSPKSNGIICGGTVRRCGDQHKERDN